MDTETLGPAGPADGPEPIEQLPWDELYERVTAPLLERQLRYVAEHSPFYKDKYRAAGLDPGDAADPRHFDRLPLSDKKEVLLDQELHPPFGRLAQTSGLQRVHTTSGTTGRPFCIVLTAADAAATIEAGRRALRCAGLGPGDSIVHCLNYCMWAGGVTDHLSLEATGALVIPFGVGNTRRLLSTIQQLRPNSISCTPSYMSRLEVVLHEELGLMPRDLGLRKAFFGGEGGLQSPAVRQQIEDRWGLRAIDANYGMADVLSLFGAECDVRAGLHFHGQGILHLELLDPETLRPLPLSEGQAGEMVLTNLRRQAQPLVRYRTGDVIQIVGLSPCPCGRSSPRFLVVGRADQMLTVRGINVYPGALAQLLGQHPAWFSGEFELVVDSPPPIEHLTLRAELAAGIAPGPPGDESPIGAALLQLCRQRLEFSPRVELLPFGTFPRTEGKTRRVRRTYLDRDGEGA